MGSESLSEARVDDLEVVTRAFALSMANVDQRMLIRDAMRASELTEHKLSLKQFVTTPQGRQFVNAAADAGRLKSGALQSAIRRLPDMDMYAPYKTHRLGWQADTNVVFGFVTNNDQAAIRAFSVAGHSADFIVVRGDVPERALLLLEPSERTSKRLKRQAAINGTTIQDPDDGDLVGCSHSRNVTQASGLR